MCSCVFICVFMRVHVCSRGQKARLDDKEAKAADIYETFRAFKTQIALQVCVTVCGVVWWRGAGSCEVGLRCVVWWWGGVV